MRKTVLKHVTTSVMIIFVAASILFSALRVMGISEVQISTKKGAMLFSKKGCSQCHYTDRQTIKIGPGFKDLFKRDNLPASQRPVTEENIRQQLISPYNAMPSFKESITDDQINYLIEYLKTL
jgi:cytochrome c2